MNTRKYLLFNKKTTKNYFMKSFGSVLVQKNQTETPPGCQVLTVNDKLLLSSRAMTQEKIQEMRDRLVVLRRFL